MTCTKRYLFQSSEKCSSLVRHLDCTNAYNLSLKCSKWFVSLSMSKMKWENPQQVTRSLTCRYYNASALNDPSKWCIDEKCGAKDGSTNKKRLPHHDTVGDSTLERNYHLQQDPNDIINENPSPDEGQKANTIDYVKLLAQIDTFMDGSTTQYPTKSQKMEFANHFNLPLADVNTLFSMWRKYRREMIMYTNQVELKEDFDTCTDVNPTNSTPIPSINILKNRNEISKTHSRQENSLEMKLEQISPRVRRIIIKEWLIQHDLLNSNAIPIKSLHYLQAKSGLTLTQIRKCIQYIKKTLNPYSEKQKEAVIQFLKHKIMSQSEDNLEEESTDKEKFLALRNITFQTLSEDEKLYLLESTQLSRLQIHEIIRAYKLSLLRITPEKAALVRSWYEDWGSRMSLQEFTEAAKKNILLSKRQITRIVKQMQEHSQSKTKRALLRKALNNLSKSTSQVTLSQAQELSKNINISIDEVWKEIRNHTLFNLSEEIKLKVINELQNTDEVPSRELIASLSKRYSLSTKQIKYIWRVYILKRRKHAMGDSSIIMQGIMSPRVNGKLIIQAWWSEHLRSPTPNEFKQLVNESTLTSKQVSDLLYCLKYPGGIVTEEKKQIIFKYVQNREGAIISSDIEELSNQTKLSKKQVQHYVRACKSPSGVINEEKKSYIIKNYKSSNDMHACIKETGLSRKQIYYILRKYQRTRNTKLEEE